MKKKNLPYIGIYVGDWERDCNSLSLEAEMAWFKIIVKMHLASECEYKTSAKALQILWKSPPNKVKEILDELVDQDIGKIEVLGDKVQFICRRLAKMQSISNTRSAVAKLRYLKKETLQTESKNQQIPEIDFDIENENVIEIDKKIETEILKKFPPAFFEIWRNWKNYLLTAQDFRYKTLAQEKAAIEQITNFSSGDMKIANSILNDSISSGWKRFFEPKNLNREKRTTKKFDKNR
jgi:hypothetical protein